MPRNRQHTEDRIRDAALGLLREQGFEGWGVNAIARAAGVDKVLIYRYFTSLEGLLEEVVRLTAFWPDPAELPAHTPEAFLQATLDALAAQVQGRALLAHPSARASGSPVRRKFTADLDRWLDGFRSHTTGHIDADQLERLPALLHFQVASGRAGLSPRELWRQVAPPLAWGAPEAGDTASDHRISSGELPAELL